MKTLALIMAGGEGGRLELLTSHRAKPAVPYGGVYRLVDFPLSNCVHSGLSDVWVLQQYQPHSLNDHLAHGRPWDLDRTRGGLRLLPPYQGEDESGWHQGNADAIWRNRSLIEEFGPDVVLVLSADHVYQLDYRAVLERHREAAADLTMVTTRVPEEEATRFGTVKVDGHGRVTAFAYKPDDPPSDVVTTEVFAYDTAALLSALDEVAGREGDPLEDFGHGLLPHLVDRGKVYEHRFDGYWRDVGTPDAYWRSHLDLVQPEPELTLDDPHWPVLTVGPQRVAARMEASASFEASLVSPGCRVAGRVERSVLGPGVVVEDGAEVYESVLLHDVVVEQGAVVTKTVADMGARIGRSARVGGEGNVTMVGCSARVPDRGNVPPGGRLE